MATRRRTTLKDVAEAVGVHVSTVSRALNSSTRHFIRAEVVQQIIDTADKLGYRPNAAAYSLRTNRTRVVGVLIPDITNPVFPPIICGIEEALAEHDYMAMMVNTDTRSERQAALIAALCARGIDGLVIASLVRDDPAIRVLAEEGLAVVTVNRRSDDPGIPSVTNDEDGGFQLVLQHLRELGHMRVASIAGPQSFSTGKARLDAFEQHRQVLGFDNSPQLVVHADALNETEGERCTAMLLDKRPRPTAIVCSNDRLAVGALTVVRQRGLACPADISITGFNDMPMVDRLEPALTTVRVQQREGGRRAARLLLELIERKGDRKPPKHIVMPVDLVVRASTGPAPAVRAATGKPLAARRK